MAGFIKLNVTSPNPGNFAVAENFGVGGQTSRYTTEVTVNAQNRPLAPTGQILWSPIILASNTSLLNIDPLHPQVSIGLRGNYLDVFGVEVRDQDNSKVLYRNQYISTADLSFQFDNTSLMERALGFWVYAFNMLNDYSDGTFVQGTFPQPPTPQLSLTLLKGNTAVVELDQLPANHPVQDVTVQVLDLTFVAPYSPSGQLYPTPGQQTYTDTPDTTPNKPFQSIFFYSNYVYQTPLLPNSIEISWAGWTYTDNGQGVLSGLGLSQTGSIDYQTGYFYVQTQVTYLGGPLTIYYEWYGTTTPPSDNTPNVAPASPTMIQQYQLSGQPSSYTVTLPTNGTYQIQAKRNDYIGDSHWSGAITVDMTAIGASGADLLLNGNFASWGSTSSGVNSQTVGLPTSWQIAEASSQGTTTQYLNLIGSFYACGLYVGNLVDSNNYVGLVQQVTATVNPGQTYQLAFNAWSNPALPRGLTVLILFRDQTGAFYAYASILPDAVITSHFPQPFTDTTTTAGIPLPVTFTVPTHGSAIMTVDNISVPITRPVDFIPSQMFVEIMNYNPPVKNAIIYISEVVLTLVS